MNPFGATLLNILMVAFHPVSYTHLDATRGGRVLFGGKPAMLPLPNPKTNKNTGQNWSTYSFDITYYQNH